MRYVALSRSSVENFERSVRGVEGIRQRRKSGALTGRNDRATVETLQMHLEYMRRLVRESDEVCAALDSRPKLAARYRRAERYVALGEWPEL